jgi:hypothetical protein
LAGYVTGGGEPAYLDAVGRKHLAALREWEDSTGRWTELATA